MRTQLYEINEIFYSLKGEGVYTGTPMAFIRLAGCNLKCKFCDTEDKVSANLNIDEILDAIKAFPTRRVVITGGEPTLQDVNTLAMKLQENDYHVHIETNGTRPFDPSLFDWIAVSPKTRELCDDVISNADEIKFLVNTTRDWQSTIINTLARYDINKETRLFVMPLAKNYQEGNRTADDIIEENVKAAIKFCKQTPNFSLCMQLHKILGIK